MGKSSSKHYKNTGDAQVDVLNKLEVHEDFHTENNIKVTVIMITVLILLVIVLYQAYRKYTRGQTLRMARSIVALQQVA